MTLKELLIRIKLKYFIMSNLDNMPSRKINYFKPVHYEILGEYYLDKPERKKFQCVKYFVSLVKSIPKMFTRTSVLPFIAKLPKI